MSMLYIICCTTTLASYWDEAFGFLAYKYTATNIKKYWNGAVITIGLVGNVKLLVAVTGNV